MRQPAIIAVLLTAGVLAGSATADEAHFVFPTELAARVESGQRGGLIVGIEAGQSSALVTVSSDIRALGERSQGVAASLEPPGDAASLALPPGFQVPELRALGQLPRDDWQLLVRVVEYVSLRVVLDEEDRGAQDVVSVLGRGRGRCSGRANAAIGMLRGLGIPARVVHGVVVGEGTVRWHRWGEAWLRQLGWVSFDPGVAVGVVSVRYIPMRGAGDGTRLAGIKLVHVDERGYARLPMRGTLRVLPSQGITVRCFGGQAFWVALYAPDGSRWVRSGRGEVRFSGLLPGRYRLIWQQSRGLREADLELGTAGHVRFDLFQLGEVGS